MHELSITQSLLEITLRHANKAGAKKVTRLNLVIGQMSSVIDESVQFYWQTIAKDTIAEGASLHFERVAAAMHCFNCGGQFSLNSKADFSCPHCQSAQVRVVSGNEFQLESIDVE